MIAMGKELFLALVDGICVLFGLFCKSSRAKFGAVIVGNLLLVPCTAPVLAAVTVIGSAVAVMALPVIKFMEA